MVEYQDLGYQYFDQRDKEQLTKRLLQRLRDLGVNVEVRRLDHAGYSISFTLVTLASTQLDRPRQTRRLTATERHHTVGRLRGCLLQTRLPESPIVPQPYEERFKSRVALQRREALVR